MERSIVEDSGEYSSSCGYCRSQYNSSVAHGVWAHTLTVEDYQELIDRGWRRSGKFLYKPSMGKTCCCPYAIRVRAEEFTPTKEQQRVQRRMDRYLRGLIGGSSKKPQPQDQVDTIANAVNGATSLAPYELENHQPVVQKNDSLSAFISGDTAEQSVPPETKHLQGGTDRQIENLRNILARAIENCRASGIFKENVSLPLPSVRPLLPKLHAQLSRTIKEQVVFTSNIAFQIFATLKKPVAQTILSEADGPRKNGGTSTLLPAGLQGGDQPLLSDSEALDSKSGKLRATRSIRDADLSVDKVADAIVAQLGTAGMLPESLKAIACKGHVNFVILQDQRQAVKSGRAVTSDAFSLSKRSRAGTPSGKSNTRQKQVGVDNGRPIADNSMGSPESPGRLGRSEVGEADDENRGKRLDISMKRASFSEEEFELYKKYQLVVHQDSPTSLTPGHYRRFLVDTPLLWVNPKTDGSTPATGFGTFHQQYRIDGKLVAVGVVDILPRCLSSKYLFWDPDYAFLSLGKYSALQEISWVKMAQPLCPSLAYYYLGYYIHTCPKMKYKSAYGPSELLCPIRYLWVPYMIAGPLLDNAPYVCLSNFASEGSVSNKLHGVTVGRGGKLGLEHPQMHSKARQDWQPVTAASDHHVSPVRAPSGENVGRQMVRTEETALRDEMMQETSLDSEDSANSMGPGEESVNGSVGRDTTELQPLGGGLSSEEAAQLEKEVQEASVRTPVFLQGGIPLTLQVLISLRILTPTGASMLSDLVSAYVALVGPQLGTRMILKIS